MLVARALSVGFIFTTATKAMTSVAATTSSKPPGLRESPGCDAQIGTPGQRLQKLLSVPGSDPRRVNDLLLLRPDTTGPSDPEPERSNSRHVVFFHGDIQVNDGVWVSRRNNWLEVSRIIHHMRWAISSTKHLVLTYHVWKHTFSAITDWTQSLEMFWW